MAAFNAPVLLDRAHVDVLWERGGAPALAAALDEGPGSSATAVTVCITGTHGIYDLAASEALGCVLVSGADQVLRLFDGETFELRRAFHADLSHDRIVISRDGEWLAAAGGALLRLYSLPAFELVWEETLPKVTSLCFPSADRLYCGCETGEVFGLRLG